MEDFFLLFFSVPFFLFFFLFLRAPFTRKSHGGRGSRGKEQPGMGTGRSQISEGKNPSSQFKGPADLGGRGQNRLLSFCLFPPSLSPPTWPQLQRIPRHRLFLAQRAQNENPGNQNKLNRKLESEELEKTVL